MKKLTHKICPRCNVKKPVSGYWNCKTGPDGLFFYCKDCSKKKASQGSTKLDCLLTVSRHAGMSVNSAKQMLKIYLEYKKTGMSLSKLLEDSKLPYKAGSLIQLMSELRKAAKDNLTLEAYFKAGRKYKPGNQVLIEGEKV